MKNNRTYIDSKKFFYVTYMFISRSKNWYRSVGM